MWKKNKIKKAKKKRRKTNESLCYKMPKCGGTIYCEKKDNNVNEWGTVRCGAGIK